jgi:hypothetical protein
LCIIKLDAEPTVLHLGVSKITREDWKNKGQIGGIQLAVEPRQCTDAESDFGPPVLAEKQIPTLELTPQSPDLAPFFSKNCKNHQKEPISSQVKISLRKQQNYLQHTHKMTSGNGLRPGRLIWSGV